MRSGPCALSRQPMQQQCQGTSQVKATWGRHVHIPCFGCGSSCTVVTTSALSNCGCRCAADIGSGAGKRFYDVKLGYLHLFSLDSDQSEDLFKGTSSSSAQALWLQAALAASTAAFKVVLMHHPPWTSG
jgi:hypothetical protein